MTYKELIEKLKTFPATDKVRFYCPVDKTYYYVYSINAETGCIRLQQFDVTSFRYGICIHLLANSRQLGEIHFMYVEQKYTTL